MFIRLFVAQERIHARHLVEAKIQNYYTVFLIVATFFTVVISGSIVTQLPEFIENPSNILTLLAKTVPQQGVFLSNYVLVNAFLGTVTWRGWGGAGGRRGVFFHMEPLPRWARWGVGQA